MGWNLYIQRWRSSIQSAKTRLGADCGSDHDLHIAKFRFKLKKVGKTTRPFSSLQFSSVAQSCPTLCDPMNRSTPGLPVHHQHPELTQTHVHWVGNAIQPSHPLSSPSPPAPNPSSIRVFSNESTLRMRWPKYWSFSFTIIPSKEYPGLISFRMDWLDLLAVQGTLKSLLQHSSKASIIRCSGFFLVQLSPPYMTTGKTIALTRQTLWSSNPTTGKPWENHNSRTHMYPSVHCSTIYNSQDKETI